jgi:hypothetical protein
MHKLFLRLRHIRLLLGRNLLLLNVLALAVVVAVVQETRELRRLLAVVVVVVVNGIGKLLPHQNLGQL